MTERPNDHKVDQKGRIENIECLLEFILLKCLFLTKKFERRKSDQAQ